MRACTHDWESRAKTSLNLPGARSVKLLQHVGGEFVAREEVTIMNGGAIKPLVALTATLMLCSTSVTSAGPAGGGGHGGAGLQQRVVPETFHSPAGGSGGPGSRQRDRLQPPGRELPAPPGAIRSRGTLTCARPGSTLKTDTPQ